MIIENIPINKINPAAYNPRKDLQPSDTEYQKLKKGIDKFDLVEPLVWNVKSGNLVGGHQRLKILKERGDVDVQVSVVDLNDADEKALNIALNKISGSWDDVQLSELLGELSAIPDFDIELTGFDIDEVASLNPAEVVEDNFDVGDALADIDEPVTKRGDIILLGKHRLYCGDSTDAGDVERLMDGKKADMVFTDPPYGIDYGGGRSTTKTRSANTKIKGDSDKDISRFIQAVLDVAGNKDYYICLSPMNLKDTLNQIPKYDGIIIWKKPQPGLGYQWVRRYCEFIIFNTERQKKKAESSMFDFWDIPTDPKKEYKHGTQKPVEVSARAMRFSSVPDDIIVDLFVGGGGSMIAAVQTNRICYGMELDPKYCDVIVKRWEDFTGQKAIRPKQ